MTTTAAWVSVSDRLPPDGVLVETKIDDAKGERNVQTLTRKGRLWWANSHACPCATCRGSSEMYVYYTPTHWRPVGGEEDA